MATDRLPVPLPGGHPVLWITEDTASNKEFPGAFFAIHLTSDGNAEIWAIDDANREIFFTKGVYHSEDDRNIVFDEIGSPDKYNAHFHFIRNRGGGNFIVEVVDTDNGGKKKSIYKFRLADVSEYSAYKRKSE